MSLEWLFLSMVPLVDVEIPLGAQALPTLSANERPSTKVDLLVGQQRGTLPKAPAALWALEGLLPLMDLLVGHESPILHKALPTLTAGERPLLRVRPHVDVEVDLCAQPLAAVGTEVGPTLGVRLPMGRQAYLQAEGTPALPAAEGPLSRVDALMGPQVAPGGETPPALPTSKELLRRVDALVSLQVALLAEGLAALLAQVCLQHHMLHYGLHGSRALSDGGCQKATMLWGRTAREDTKTIRTYTLRCALTDVLCSPQGKGQQGVCGLPHFSASFHSAAEAVFVAPSPALSDLLQELLGIPGDCRTEKNKGKIKAIFLLHQLRSVHKHNFRVTPQLLHGRLNSGHLKPQDSNKETRNKLISLAV